MVIYRSTWFWSAKLDVRKKEKVALRLYQVNKRLVKNCDVFGPWTLIFKGNVMAMGEHMLAFSLIFTLR